MRILLLGATGFIGKTIFSVLKENGHDIYGTYHSRLPEIQSDNFYPFDLTAPETIDSILTSVQPEIIISSLRGDFSRQLGLHKVLTAYIKSKPDRKLIFISTANVFDNDLNCPHTESDIPNAESDYGLYKTECENMLISALATQAIIIRIPSVWDKNCPRIQQLITYKKDGKALQMWDDLMMNYTTPTQIANVISYIIANNLEGIFHVGTRDMMKYWDFYQEIMRRLHLEAPEIDMEQLDKTYYQAVLPARSDLPENLQMTVEDVLIECC